MSRDSIIRARNLTKRYGNRTVVDGIDFDVSAGQCFGFLGPNGAGKTTVLRMAMGLTPASEGELSVFGLPIPQKAAEARLRIGIVPQADNLDPDFSVVENLRVYASFFGIGRREAEPRIERLLAFANLEDRRDARTDTLSGGMQRRLTIARALINEPELVVLDEPTTGLDPQARHVIWGRLSELKERNTTLVLTTHYMEEAERLCDRLLIMDQGRILDQGSPRELIARHVESDVIEIRGHHPGVEALLQGPHDWRVERMGTSIYIYTNAPDPLIDHLQNHRLCTYLHRPSDLEDVFLKLTGRELRD